MRTRVYLMRHGAVDYMGKRKTLSDGREVVALTEEGLQQARDAGEALIGAGLTHAFASPLTRAQETAETVLQNAEADCPLETLEGLRELQAPSFDPRGHTPESLARLLDTSLAQAPLEGARFLGDGEVFVDAVGRITGSFDVILRTVAGGAALVVAHEGVNRLALGWATGGGLAAATTFEQDLGCLNILDFDVDEDFTITRVIVKAVNVLPRDPCLRSDRRTSVESLFQLQAGTIRREAVGKG